MTAVKFNQKKTRLLYAEVIEPVKTVLDYFLFFFNPEIIFSLK